MAIKAVEHYRQIRGDENALRIGYVVTGADSETAALTHTRSVAPDYWPPLGTTWTPPAPPVFDDLANESWALITVGIEEIDAPDQTRASGVNTFYTAANYAFRATCPIYDFDISTQSVKVTEAISTVPYVEAGLGTLPYGNAIEVSVTGQNLDVRGTTKSVPNARLALTWVPVNYFAVSPTYLRNAMSMVGKVNSARFLEDALDAGFREESLLFTGFTGKQIDQRNNYWELRYQFAYAQENMAQLTFDQITVPANQVKGFDYVFIQRDVGVKNMTGGSTEPQSVPTIRQVNVQKIYDTADFNDLFRVGAVNTGALYVVGCPGFKNVSP